MDLNAVGVPRNSLNTFSGRLFGELVAAIARMPPVVVSADSMAWGVKRQWTQRRPEAKAQRGEAKTKLLSHPIQREGRRGSGSAPILSCHYPQLERVCAG